jgi:hypothetical protein
MRGNGPLDRGVAGSRLQVADLAVLSIRVPTDHGWALCVGRMGQSNRRVIKSLLKIIAKSDRQQRDASFAASGPRRVTGRHDKPWPYSSRSLTHGNAPSNGRR